MDRFEVMQLFLRVVDTESFSRGSTALGVSQATASKAIAALESRLGTQLLRRTTRGMSLTDEGRVYYQSVSRLIGDLETAEASVRVGHGAPSGVVRVALSAGFGRLHVLPHLREFVARFPEVTLELNVSERRLNLIDEGIDVAIRIGHLADSALVARQIGSVEYVTVGTPQFFSHYGMPAHPRDVYGLPGVVFMNQGVARPWKYQFDGETAAIEPKVVVRTNDAELIRASVIEGIGAGHHLSMLFAEELLSGKLVRALPGFSPPPFPVSAVYPSGRRKPGKVQVLVEFLAEKFAGVPELNVASGTARDA